LLVAALLLELTPEIITAVLGASCPHISIALTFPRGSLHEDNYSGTDIHTTPFGCGIWRRTAQVRDCLELENLVSGRDEIPVLADGPFVDDGTFAV
jgi:hypothetical protein